MASRGKLEQARREGMSFVDYHFDKGDKVVQMVVIPCLTDDIEAVDELTESIGGRNTSGWGSTGK